MYSYDDENFIMNSVVEYDKYIEYVNQLNKGVFEDYIELENFPTFLAALDSYVHDFPEKINNVIDYLGEVINTPQKYLVSNGIAEQHIEAAPRILWKKKLQYKFMVDGKEYEANSASLDAQRIYLEASHDVGLEMELFDVVENVEHDISLIELRKKIEFAKHKCSTDMGWQQKLELLENDYEELINSKKMGTSK